MTKYTCTDCTGRGDELVIFEIRVGGVEYKYDPKVCPICGQTSTVEALSEYFGRTEREGFEAKDVMP